MGFLRIKENSTQSGYLFNFLSAHISCETRLDFCLSSSSSSPFNHLRWSSHQSISQEYSGGLNTMCPLIKSGFIEECFGQSANHIGDMYQVMNRKKNMGPFKFTWYI